MKQCVQKLMKIFLIMMFSENSAQNFGCKIFHFLGGRPVIFHCVKSVHIRSFFWPVFSRIRTEYGEIRENTDQKKLRIWKLFTQCKKQRFDKNTNYSYPFTAQIYLLKVNDESTRGMFEHNFEHNPTDIYLFKVNNGNIRTMCETCSKLTRKTPTGTMSTSFW